MTKRRRAFPTKKVTIAVDVVTDAAVTALVAKEGLTYTAAFCALATNAALKDPDLVEAMRKVIAEATTARLERDGYHPGLSGALARELVGLQEGAEKLTWN